MLGNALLWAAEQPRVKRLITDSKLTRPVVDRFVAGDNLEDAIEAIKDLNAHGIGGILDFLGEGVSDGAAAQAAADDYLTAVNRIVATGLDTTVSVKLTQLGLAFDKGACIDHLRRLAAEAQAVEARVEIDMEQSEFVSDTIEIYKLLKVDFPELRLAMQVYMRRTPVDLQAMAGERPRVRLVKGAYAEPGSLALQKKDEIESQYEFLTDWLFDRGDDPAIATHDSRLIDHARAAADRTHTGKDGFEIQMLYGIRRELQRQLAAEGFRVRVYVPYGIAWYPYLMRRIAERPANIRFFLRAVLRG